ncbi:hypothetical protein HPB49_003285 [Dermacentor silvarum]|uniref:Uncharacterized protein n=1 Tax=Dermacentor silvarum TaxID=543639 RepID=A0ACB8DAA2_DERSI|nr:hypothetical protein HPB49_003285 [Dermacentor silvarum]
MNTFRLAFRHVKCVIIGEISMLSSTIRNAIDNWLRQITHRLDAPFGRLDVILCGDPRQLPPRDATFSTILTKIGDRTALLPEEISLLENKFVSAEVALRVAPATVTLFYSKEEVRRFNTLVASIGGKEVTRVVADDVCLCYRTNPELVRAVEKVAHTEMANLPHEILLVIGKPYMITANIDVLDGIVNSIQRIITPRDCGLPLRFPIPDYWHA